MCQFVVTSNAAPSPWLSGKNNLVIAIPNDVDRIPPGFRFTYYRDNDVYSVELSIEEVSDDRFRMRVPPTVPDWLHKIIHELS